MSKVKSLSFIGLSKWIASAAELSPLLKGRVVKHLPNLIDVEVFSPLDKQQARIELGLSRTAKIVLFGAMGASSDPRKGYYLLKDSLKLLPGDHQIEFVVFGGNVEDSELSQRINIRSIGNIHDDSMLAKLYNAADVMVVPSIQENLSNAIMESLSCGTPVVAFDIGGNKDMIDHKLNGYLAKAFDVQDLADGILWILDSDSATNLKINSRKKVIKNFSDSIVPEYIRFYGEILKTEIKS